MVITPACSAEITRFDSGSSQFGLVAQLVERGANVKLLRQGSGFETRQDLLNTGKCLHCTL
jgi:hypothetical protein